MTKRSLLIALVIVLLAPLASPQAGTSKTPRTIAIVNARIIPVVGTEVPKGTIVIKDGLIAAVGAEVAVPAGAEVVDAAGLRAYPGMIDGCSSLGLVEISGVAATVDRSETGRINPQARALEAIRYDSMHIPIVRSNGITAAVVAPSGGLVSGVSCLLKLDGWTNREMAVKPAAAMHIELPGLRGARGGFSGGRGAAQVRADGPTLLAELKELFAAARAYEKRRDAAAQNRLLALPEFNETYECLLPLIKGELPAMISVHSERDIKAAIQFVQDEKLKAVFRGCAQGFKVADKIKQSGIPVIIDSLYTGPSEPEDGYDAPYRNVVELAKAGVLISFSTGDSPAQGKDLPYHAAKAVAFGLPYEEAVKALTINPARIFGVEDRLGSIEPGKDADLIIAMGDPLDMKTEVKQLVINGRAIDMANWWETLYQKFKSRPEK